MEFEVVYDAIESYRHLKKTIIFIVLATAFPAIFLALKEWRSPLAEVKRYEDQSSWLVANQHRIMAVWIASIYFITSIMFLGYANSGLQKSEDRIRDKSYKTLQGEALKIPGTYEGKRKAFSVSGVRFEHYQTKLLSMGRFYNNCSESCLISDGDRVIVRYYTNSEGSNSILKVMKLKS